MEVWRGKSMGDVWRVREICEKRVEVCVGRVWSVHVGRLYEEDVVV